MKFNPENVQAQQFLSLCRNNVPSSDHINTEKKEESQKDNSQPSYIRILWLIGGVNIVDQVVFFIAIYFCQSILSNLVTLESQYWNEIFKMLILAILTVIYLSLKVKFNQKQYHELFLVISEKVNACEIQLLWVYIMQLLVITNLIHSFCLFFLVIIELAVFGILLFLQLIDLKRLQIDNEKAEKEAIFCSVGAQWICAIGLVIPNTFFQYSFYVISSFLAINAIAYTINQIDDQDSNEFIKMKTPQVISSQIVRDFSQFIYSLSLFIIKKWFLQ